MPKAASVIVEVKGRDKTGKTTKEVERKFKSLGSSLKSISLSQIAAIGGVTLAIQKSITAFANFDTRIREITTLLDGVTQDTIKQMGEEVQNLAKEYGQSVNAMAKARYDAISAGFTDAADSAKLLGVAAKLAVAGVSDVSKTTDVLTSVLNAYGKSADSAEHISDVLFTTVRLGKTTVDQLASGLGRAAAIAPQIGISFETLSAAIATLTAGGQSTDEVITAMTATMTQLLKPSEDLQKRIESFGFTSGQALIEAKGFDGALRLLTEGATQADLAAYFGNVRAIKAIFPLAGKLSGKFNDSVKAMGDTALVTNEAYGKMEEGIGHRLNVLKVNFEVTMIRLGETLLPLAEGIVSLFNSFDNLDDSTQTFIATAGVLTPVIAGLVALLGPAGALVVGIGAATLAIVGFFNKVEVATEEVNKLREASASFSLEEITREMVNVMSKLNVLTELQSKLEDGVNWEAIKASYKLVFGEEIFTTGQLGSAIETLKAKHEVLFEALQKVRQGVEGIGDAVDTNKDKIDDLVISLTNIDDLIEKEHEFEIAQDYAEELNTMQEQLSFFGDLLKEFYLTDTEERKLQLLNQFESAIKVWDNTMDLIDNFVKNKKKLLEQSVKDHKDALKREAQLVKDFTTDMEMDFLTSIKHIKNRILNHLFDTIIEKWFGEVDSFLGKMIIEFFRAFALILARALALKLFIKTIGGPLGFLIFSGGGIVGGLTPMYRKPVTAQSGLMVGTDTIPALLTPGETVISKRDTQDNRSDIENIISGRKESGQTIEVNVQPQFAITAIDSQGIADFVTSIDFRQAVTNAVNEGLLRLEVSGVSVKGIS